MNKKTLRIAGWALGLSMAVAGIGVAVGASQWANEPVMTSASEDDTHDFSQTLQQQLNNSASISSIDIAEQNYAIKKVTVSYRYNKTIENAVTVTVSVGGTSWGSKYVEGTGSNYSTLEFEHDAMSGEIVISFTNNTGDGTGHGTFYVNNVQLTEGPAASTYKTESISISGSISGSYNTNTSVFNNSGFSVSKHLVNPEDPTDFKDAIVASGITYHWEYVDSGATVTLPIEDAGSYNVRIWASITVDDKTINSKDNENVNARYVTGTLVVAEAPSELTISYSSYSSNLPSSGYSTIGWSSGDIEGKIQTIKNDNSYIQFQANGSFIYNTKAVSGYITKITIGKASGSYSGLTAFVSDSEKIDSKPAEGGVSNNSNWVWNFDANEHYTYFRIDSTSSGAKYFSDITIEYQKVKKVDPTGIILNDSSAISMDTYGYGRRTLIPTVQPFNNNDDTVTWGTTNPSVVTVENGVLTATGVGSASVYATTANYVDDLTTPALKVSVPVTVTQAEYKKARFIPTSKSTVSSTDDYLDSGSATLSFTDGTYSNEKEGLQITTNSGSATFTISGYKGMKITGVDLVMSSNATAGSGSLTVTAGSSNLLSISGVAFSDASWNGAYDANPCDIYKATTEHVVADGEDITFVFSASVNSLYVHSVAVRYLDYSLESWCSDFLSGITCTGVTKENPNGAILDASQWDSLGIEFLDIEDDDLKDIAKKSSANPNGTVIQQAMARYDAIIRKYGSQTYDDFIGRFSVGGANAAGAYNPESFVSDSRDKTGIALIAILGASMTFAGFGFLYRKRREEE